MTTMGSSARATLMNGRTSGWRWYVGPPLDVDAYARRVELTTRPSPSLPLFLSLSIFSQTDDALDNFDWDVELPTKPKTTAAPSSSPPHPSTTLTSPFPTCSINSPSAPEERSDSPSSQQRQTDSPAEVSALLPVVSDSASSYAPPHTSPADDPTSPPVPMSIDASPPASTRSFRSQDGDHICSSPPSLASDTRAHPLPSSLSPFSRHRLSTSTCAVSHPPTASISTTTIISPPRKAAAELNEEGYRRRRAALAVKHEHAEKSGEEDSDDELDRELGKKRGKMLVLSDSSSSESSNEEENLSAVRRRNRSGRLAATDAAGKGGMAASSSSTSTSTATKKTPIATSRLPSLRTSSRRAALLTPRSNPPTPATVASASVARSHQLSQQQQHSTASQFQSLMASSAARRKFLDSIDKYLKGREHEKDVDEENEEEDENEEGSDEDGDGEGGNSKYPTPPHDRVAGSIAVAGSGGVDDDDDKKSPDSGFGATTEMVRRLLGAEDGGKVDGLLAADVLERQRRSENERRYGGVGGWRGCWTDVGEGEDMEVRFVEGKVSRSRRRERIGGEKGLTFSL